MFLSSVVYLLVFLICWVVIGGVLTGLFDLSWDSLLQKRFVERLQQASRGDLDLSRAFSVTSTIIRVTIVFLSLPMVYFALAGLGYRPPLKGMEASVVVSQHTKGERFQELSQEAESIQTTLDKIEDLSIGEIRQSLTDTLEFVKRLKVHAAEQERLAAALKAEADSAADARDRARSEMQVAKNLSGEQLEVVADLVTKESKEESSAAFWKGVALSFPIGIITSLVAAYIVALREFWVLEPRHSANAFSEWFTDKR